MHSEKKMSLFDLVFMGIGGCIGAGIYSMLGVGIGLTGRSVALAFLIAMLFKMSQQTRMIVTSSMFNLSGGVYSQSALVLTPMLTGVAALNNLFNKKLKQHEEYIKEYGIDMPEILNWKWN